MTIDDSTQIPETIRDVDHLDRLLSTPTEGVIDTFARLEGDVIILGVAGKMGPTLAWMARRAFDASGRRDRRVVGVARFTNPATRVLAPRPRCRDDPLRPARARRARAASRDAQRRLDVRDEVRVDRPGVPDLGHE